MLKPTSCDGCPLVSKSNGFTLPEGMGTNGVCIVGEAAGYNEYLEGLPFRPKAQAGSKLEEVFKLVGMELGIPVTRNQFRIVNLVQCNPFNDLLAGMAWEGGAVEHCKPNLEKVLGERQYVILALGNLALKYLCGVSGIAEEKQSITHLRGYVLESKYGLVVPSLHPSFIKRGNNNLTPLLVEDMKKAMGIARGTYTSYMSHRDYKSPEYQVMPSVDEAKSFYYQVKDNPRAILSYDIETPRTGSIDEDERDDLEDREITLVQFSIGKNTAIALPFRDEYVGIVEATLKLANSKIGFNSWNFDDGRLGAKGIRVSKSHDLMWMFKHWQPGLPRGLQSVASHVDFPFPWKHLYGSKLEWYGCADVDSLQWIIEVLPKLMKGKGVWEGYKEHVYNIHPILQRASDIGIPVNEQKRLALGGILENGEVDPNASENSFTKRREAINKEIQLVIPDEIRNIKPKRKNKETGEFDYGYIRQPAIVEKAHDIYLEMSNTLTRIGKKVTNFETYLYRKHNLAACEFEVDVNGDKERIVRWAVVEDFKASSTQMIRYLKWKQGEIRKEIAAVKKDRLDRFNGRNPELTARINELEELAEDYEVPIDIKTKRQTTGKKELEEMYLNTGDPVLEKVVRIRSFDTNINNYIPNWKPSKDGRVHTTWGFTSPAGQFDSRRPNVLNCSKHTDFGNEFREIIEAPEGYTFVEFDYKSFHVATMGYCANDRDYIRYSQLDPHSILGSYIDPSVIGGSISLKWSDADIKMATGEFKRRCKEHKAKDKQHNIDVRQELAKPTVLGNQLELGAKKLQRQNRRFIKTIREAEKLQDIVKGLFPKEEVYKKFIKEKGWKEHFLVNEFGYVQYFYDIFNFFFNKSRNSWDRREGEGAREPISFRVHGCAFGVVHLGMLECERKGLCERYSFQNSIHDSVIFMPSIAELDGCIESVYGILTQPCGKLRNEATGDGGLQVGVEVAVGKNWRDMKEIKV